MLWVVFFSTLAAYNWAYFSFRKKEYLRLFFVFLSLGVAIALAFLYLKTETLVLLVVLGSFSLLYAVPLKGKRFREIPGLKLYEIALVWSVTVVLLPAVEMGAYRNIAVGLQLLAVFLFVMAITIPFDIRDLKNDPHRLQTIPQKIGIERSVSLSNQLLVFSFVLFFISRKGQIDNFLAAYLIAVVYSISIIKNSIKNQSKWLISFGLEAASLVPWLLWFLGFVLEME